MSSTLLRRQSSLVGVQSSRGGDDLTDVLPNLKRLPSLKPTTMVPVPSLVYWEDENDGPHMTRLAHSIHTFFGIDFRAWMPMNGFTYALLYEDKSFPLFALFVLLIVSPFVLFPVFLCLKIDGTVTWTWSAALAPLWVITVFNYLYIPCLHYALREPITEPVVRTEPASPEPSTTPEAVDDLEPELVSAFQSAETGVDLPRPEDVDREALPPPTRSTFAGRRILMGICILLTQLFVSLRLDSTIGWSWLVVLIPLLSFFVLDWDHTYYVPWKKDGIFHIAQIVFLGLKLDGNVSWAWSIVFLPTWLSVAVILATMVHAAWRRKSSESHVIVSFVNLLQVISVLIYFSPFILTVVRLDTSFSAFIIFLPWFAVMVAWWAVVIVDAFAATNASTSEDILNHVEITSWYFVLPWDVSNILPLLLMTLWPILAYIAPSVREEPEPPETSVAPAAQEGTPQAGRLRPPTRQPT
ncbi:hypothetical protein AC1031_017284 [Aphanomyces cochlioides]|nr:hypothetical protein AC1031_017284 [Aphanomyces cochlioides]